MKAYIVDYRKCTINEVEMEEQEFIEKAKVNLAFKTRRKAINRTLKIYNELIEFYTKQIDRFMEQIDRFMENIEKAKTEIVRFKNGKV